MGFFQTEVLTDEIDAALLRRLRIRGEARDPDGISDFGRALTCCAAGPSTGWAPAAGPGSKRDRLNQHMLCVVVDVALHCHPSSRSTRPTWLGTGRRAGHTGRPTRVDPVAGTEGHVRGVERLLRDDLATAPTNERAHPELSERIESIIASHDLTPGEAASRPN